MRAHRRCADLPRLRGRGTDGGRNQPNQKELYSSPQAGDEVPIVENTPRRFTGSGITGRRGRRPLQTRKEKRLNIHLFSRNKYGKKTIFYPSYCAHLCSPNHVRIRRGRRPRRPGANQTIFPRRNGYIKKFFSSRKRQFSALRFLWG